MLLFTIKQHWPRNYLSLIKSASVLSSTRLRAFRTTSSTKSGFLLLVQTRLHLVLTASSSAYAARTRDLGTLVKSRDGTSPRFLPTNLVP